MDLLECVPNVSEGRDATVIARLGAAVRSVGGVTLADVHSDVDHHRSVFTLLGPPDAVVDALLALAAAAVAAIDMRRHHGLHPRVGAVDVVPFVPLGATPMATAIAAAHRAGAALAARHGVPVYYYGAAAQRDDRRALPDVRRGGYEGLAARLATPAGRPDAGPARFVPRTGAMIVGARSILVAFNVWLDTADVEAARAVAALVRERGGGLPAVRALGVALPSRGVVQVSLNLVDYRVTPIPVVFDRVCEEAGRRGLRLRRAELVGLVPLAAFAGRSPESVGLPGLAPTALLDTWLPAGVRPS